MGDLPACIENIKNKHPSKKIIKCFEDESRFGQKTIFRRVWCKKGIKPIRIKQDGFLCAYIFGIIEPETGRALGYVCDQANKQVMKMYLQEYSKQLGVNEHAIIFMDGAKWYLFKDEELPGNISIIILPPYSPELNPKERGWRNIKAKYLAFQKYKDKSELIKEGAEAWNQFTKQDILKSLYACSYI